MIITIEIFALILVTRPGPGCLGQGAGGGKFSPNSVMRVIFPLVLLLPALIRSGFTKNFFILENPGKSWNLIRPGINT